MDVDFMDDIEENPFNSDDLESEEVTNSLDFSIDRPTRNNRREAQETEKVKLLKIEKNLGFSYFNEDKPRTGWLLNTQETRIGPNDEVNALAMYFVDQQGNSFKCYSLFRPYFFIKIKNPAEKYKYELMNALQKRFSSLIHSVEPVEKLDLDMPNHWNKTLSCLKVVVDNSSKQQSLRRELQSIVNTNNSKKKVKDVYFFSRKHGHLEYEEDSFDIYESIEGIREYDYPYITRSGIDLNIFVGSWYEVQMDNSSQGKEFGCTSVKKLEMIEKPKLTILAFDIECCKRPLKFPDPSLPEDEVFMISYMVNGDGYLIINRSIVSKDINDFLHAPKEEYKANFKVTNVQNEKELISAFYKHCQELQPHIFSTYNGDSFDFWYLDVRSKIYDLDMSEEIGFANVKRPGKEGDIGFQANREYLSPCSVHMDCLYWVKRDSYLPAGSRSLKKVTAAKLGFDPVEIEPEKMTEFAKTNPLEMATYSVSDALITYFLFDKYINNFIFSLCTIIPMQADQVLRKGSGTLCEMLLMTEAFRNNIIAPNKTSTKFENFNKAGRFIEKETYVGGHVECLESGVFRSDLLYGFKPNFNTIDTMIANIERDLTFNIVNENKTNISDVINLTEVIEAMRQSLLNVRKDWLKEKAKIYHLDVSAMYPNIILTNRLQPSSIVANSTCTGCDYRNDTDLCQRKMDWMWRGDVLPSTKGEYNMVKTQLEHENLNKNKQFSIYNGKFRDELTQRLKTFCGTTYGRKKDTLFEKREGIVCQREHGFYVDTVRNFRDRRYQYKRLTKKFAKEKKSLSSAGAPSADIKAASDKVVLYDSLQLAHKCILNSFYGYVMRKGSRWFSMEMAAMVTHTGANIIKQAKGLIEGVGRVLELDTDGVWCILPESFPEDFTVKLQNGKTISVSYPCMMLNCLTHQLFTNHQYQTLVTGPDGIEKYQTHSECSIYFEVDGPYRCMVIPASQEEDKLLKKRYAVFNYDGSLAELKGFELKRRGELDIVKRFQKECFPKFLNGETLSDCYKSVAEVANKWLQVLVTKGEGFSDIQLIELLAENRSMSKALADYGDKKSNSITTARRLSDFLGKEMVANAGLNCKLIIAKEPAHAATSERAIPCAIFSAAPDVTEHFIYEWTGSHETSLKNVLDWDYYMERLGATILKIISIPALLQGIKNPVNHVVLPKWANLRRIKSKKITTFFQKEQRSKVRAPVKRIVAPEVIHSQPIAEKEVPASNFRYSNDFNSWIRDRKRRWKRGRFALKKLKTGDQSFTPIEIQALKRDLKVRNLDGFIQNQRTVGVDDKSSWEVIDVQKVNGLYKLKLCHSHKDIFKDVFVEGYRCLREALIQIGCLVTLNIERNDVRLGNIQKPLSSEHLTRHNSFSGSYLHNVISTAFLYHICSGDAHFVILFLRSSETSVKVGHQSIWEASKYYIWTTTDRDLSNTKDPTEILKSLILKASVDSNETSLPSISKGNIKENFSSFGKIITDVKLQISRRSMSTPYIVIQSNNTSHSGIFRRVLHSVYPVVYLNSDASTNSLRFENELIKDSIISFIQHHNKFKRLVATASYAQIPISHLIGDIPKKIFNCLFGRMMDHNNIQYNVNGSEKVNANIDKLFKQKSENVKEEEVFQKSNQYEPHYFQEIFSCDSDQNDLLYEKEGFYSNYCLEIRLGCLVVNAILKAEQILAFEKSRLKDFSANYAKCARKFAILKTIVQNLVHDVTKSGNEFADMILNNVFRLITDRDGDFFDVELCRMVEELLRKLFYQLLSEVSECGADVIFGSQQKIIVATKVNNSNEADAFFVDLKDHIKSLEMFKVLFFEVDHKWASLLYVNEFNFAGLKPNETGTVSFVFAIDTVLKFRETSREMIEYVVELFLKENQMPVLPKQGLSNKIKKVLLDFAQESLQSQQDTKEDWIDIQKAILIASYLLELKSDVTSDVNILRRSAFRLLESSEFSDEVEISQDFFVESYDVVLRNITCSKCHYCTRYNLSHLARKTQQKSVHCLNCDMKFDILLIESRLVKNLQIELKQFLVNDVECSTCQNSKEDAMSKVCISCSGKYRRPNKIVRLWSERDELLLYAYKEVATRFSMDFLHSVTSSYRKYL